MSKPIQTALIAALVVIAALSVFLFTRYQKVQSELAGSRVSEQQAADRYGRMIQDIAEIQDSLNAISTGPKGVQMVSKDLTAERQMGGPNKQEALDRIAVLKTSLTGSQERIAALEKQMKQSGVKVAGMEKLIANLKADAATKQMMIAQLSAQVDSLNTQVTGLTATVAEQRDTLQTRQVQLTQKQQELATVYYIVGTKKELEKAGVIRSTGGVLGLGDTSVPTTDPPAAAFTPLNTDEQTTIELPTAKAKVLSAQAASSYELRLVGSRMELHITNPQEFRKIKQVIILAS
jgi:uncharacterized protein (DUF3084 family)